MKNKDSISANPQQNGKAPTLLQPAASSPLKWAGGKRWLVPHVAKHWLNHSSRRYVEPFCGGLSVALGLNPRRAILNDSNPHLINFYRQVQSGLKLTLDMHYDEKLFYRHRDRLNQLIRQKKFQTSEAAQLFYYLNRTCFNGLCRFNRAGEFNTPFGQYASVNYAADFSDLQKATRQWRFSNGNATTIKLRADDFVYADPPYDVEFTTYSAGGFSWEDQVRAAEWLARHDGPVILSNQATKRIVKLYRALGFKLRFLDGPRRISCNGDRTAAKEVLAFRNV